MKLERRAGRIIAVAVLLAFADSAHPGAYAAPPLPVGLGEESNAPALPDGLSDGSPPLPVGLGAPAEDPEVPADDGPGPGKSPAWQDWALNGFWETRAGARTRDADHQKPVSIGETRLQLQAERAWETVTLRTTGDLLYDPVLNHPDIDLETGDGWLDLREAYALLRPAPFLDLKIGRQILTWGTGDMLFLNDLFPKDWNAFFIGRDDEYLKAASDAIKASVFSDVVNLDLVYTPRFDSDRFIDGRRIGYWQPGVGRVGRNALVKPIRPDDWFSDDELAVRAFRNLRGYELAAYGYWGFWKSPNGQDAATGRATFPELAVIGASVRGEVANGIGSLELARYHTVNDRNGDDPLQRNGEWRVLAGYERELARDLTGGLQYYLEVMDNYTAYRNSLPPGMEEKDARRHVLTLRLTQLLLNQNLTLSLFGFFSPSDSDLFVRPRAQYRVDDHWTVEAGGNLFAGAHPHTFFGQFEDDSNAYLSVRYGF